MLKGWSLIGDALSHAIVPGVAGAYMLGLPFSIGAFFSGGLAALAMLFLNQRTKLREDAIIGLIFTSFFALGLFMVSLSPTSVNIQTIVLGNILAITPGDLVQLVIICGVSMTVLLLKWKDLLATFFDEDHARSVGLNTTALRLVFFTLLAACTVAALQTVGAFLVIAMVVTPGATAYLLTDRFPRLIILSVAIGAITSFLGAYISYFLNGATGGVIVILMTGVFLVPRSSWRPSMACWRPGRRRAQRWRRGHDGNSRLAHTAVRLRVHAAGIHHHRPAFGADGGAVLLPGAEGLVADGGRDFPRGAARHRAGLHHRCSLWPPARLPPAWRVRWRPDS